MNLTGALPESLGSLDEMSGKIEFRDDSLLVGEMPAFLWNWVKVDRFQVKFAGYTSMDVTGIENMVNLTEFNTEGTPFTGTIPGEIFTLPAMVKLYFHNSEFDALPAELTQASGLDRLYLNGDNFSELPDMSGMTWGPGAKIRVQDNFLTFEDLESNVAISMDTLVDEFRYSPQANVGEETTLMPEAGSEVSLSVEVGGSENIYTWIKGEDAVGDSSTYVIDSYDETTDAGVYFALVQSALVPGLDIMSNTTTLLGSPAVSDSLALVELYNECGGEEWVGYDTWLQGPINDWEGVTIDSATGRVTNVEFRDMNLTGTLPESLGSLEEMSGKIEFRDDSLLVGEMPAFLWNWVKVDRFQIKFAGYTSMDVTGIENMVNLTEFNTEGTPFTGMIPGAIFTLPSMVKLYFHNSEFDALPAELTQASGLDRLYLNGDNFSELPDMSGMTWGEGAKIRVQDNFLTFEDLESNVVIASDTLVEEFNYSPQANVGMADTIDLNTGDTLTISAEVGGSANMYTWVKGVDEVIDGQTEASLQIDSVTVDDSGSYFVLVQNATVPGLDIFSEATVVNVSPPSGVDEVPFEGLKVLGNPVDQRLLISSDELITQVSVFSVDGQLIYRQFPASNNVDIDMATYTSGLYVVMLQNETKYQIIKIAKD
jgi:Leucine-rich repeat (LRR) protein